MTKTGYVCDGLATKHLVNVRESLWVDIKTKHLVLGYDRTQPGGQG